MITRTHVIIQVTETQCGLRITLDPIFSLVSVICSIFHMHLHKGDTIWLSSCLYDLLVQQQAHTGERLLSELATGQMPPRGLIGCQTSACERANQMGEELKLPVET